MVIAKNNNKEYTHPLLINGERYFLNKDPFLYAEEGVAKYWEGRVENLAFELAWKDISQGNEPPSHDKLLFTAARMLAPHFLADDRFFDYYKQDGGDMIKETNPLFLFPERAMEYEEKEREIS